MTPDPKPIVLAYSGGLDTSVILRWLIERYRCEVVAFCADLGQGAELIPVRDKALRTGAGSVHIVDLREMIYYGSPERAALQGLVDDCARDVTGTVRLKLYKGNVTVLGRRSPRSLYRTDFATFEADSVYRQRDAEGFINLNALRLRIRALRDRT